jgi:3-carboxy-cis,cis-muconate cycloisomerase
MAGRTFMQQALPISFGFKVAGWLSALLRARERFGELSPRLMAVQFGGAAGTLAALGGKGRAVQEALARELKLGVPDMPWHSARDRFAELALQFALVCGTLAKMARDVALLMQTEIAEVSEPAEAGRGGSSTMPHKRNPVAATAILAACEQVQALSSVMLRAMGQEHERGTGGWHAEWLALPEIVVYGASALDTAGTLAEGLVVDTKRMRANLDLTHGLIMAEAAAMALAGKLGRLAAHEKVGEACAKAIAEKRHLSAVLAEDADIAEAIGAGELERLFDPAGYMGEAGGFVDAVAAAADNALKDKES